MTLYDEFYNGDDVKLAEESYLKAVSALEETKLSQRSFFFVSSDSVFDRTIKKEYSEGSAPNSRKPSSLFLIETEKKVIEYSKGYVYRKQDLMKDITPLIDSLISLNEDPVFCQETVRPISNKLYSDLIEYAMINNFGYHKIIHLAVPTEMPIYEIWFCLKGAEFKISENNPSFVFKNYIGGISSSILKTFDFYGKMLIRNKKEVLSYLRERSFYDTTNGS